MREPNLVRLNSLEIKKNAADYIVMYFLIQDLKHAISKYAFGKILDVGCGNKPYESLFNTTAENYTGCDVVQSSGNKVDILCKIMTEIVEKNIKNCRNPIQQLFCVNSWKFLEFFLFEIDFHDRLLFFKG